MSVTDLTQLAELGIPLPPSSAFKVDLSEKEKMILFFWTLARIAALREAKSVDTVAVTVGTSASKILDTAPAPRQLVMQNNSDTATVWIAIGRNPTTSFGVKLPPGGYYESPFDFVEAVFAIGSASAQVTLVTSKR